MHFINYWNHVLSIVLMFAGECGGFILTIKDCPAIWQVLSRLSIRARILSDCIYHVQLSHANVLELIDCQPIKGCSSTRCTVQLCFCMFVCMYMFVWMSNSYSKRTVSCSTVRLRFTVLGDTRTSICISSTTSTTWATSSSTWPSTRSSEARPKIYRFSWRLQAENCAVARWSNNTRKWTPRDNIARIILWNTNALAS